MIRTGVLTIICTALVVAQEYKLGPDSERRAGVPQGKVTEHTWSTSKVFPGTVRKYWVYVPAQYKAEKPAALMIFQDGAGHAREDGPTRIPIVLDNLIHHGRMPATIAILIDPGTVPATEPGNRPRENRSFEYDSMSDRYARFLIDEIIPEVSKTHNISSDPNDRGIAGQSSGAICALIAAWHRPDQFRRVLSFIGSYTNLRGGNHVSSIIRKSETKPIRVYLQDGSGDLNNYAGNWWIANQEIASALEFAGYDFTFVKGTEAHNMRHGGAVMPEALTWLWREHPKPIAKPVPTGRGHVASQIIDPAKDWEMVSQGHRFTEGPAVNAKGEVFFTDIPNNRIHKIGLDGKVSVFKEDTGGANGLMFGPDGRLYACQNGRRRIVAYSEDGAETTIATDITSNDLAVTSNGNLYVTDPPQRKVWLIAKDGTKTEVHSGIGFPNGVRLSPDQSQLYVADYNSRTVFIFTIQPDGRLANEEPFIRLDLVDDVAGPARADGMTVDSQGFLYVTTFAGLQVVDTQGRVNAILSKPQPGALANVVFGGPKLDVLYVTAGDKVFRRPMRRTGVFPWEVAKAPPAR